MERDDLEIIAEIRAGDRDAYRFLVDRYKDRLLGVLVRMLADRDLAEEAAQEAFVKAYLALPRFRGESGFGTWLVQIGIHSARDRLRRQSRRRRFELPQLDDRDENSAPEPMAAGPDALARLVSEEDSSRLLAALQLLPDDYREVLVLKHLEGWSFEEIAVRAGASVGALKIRAHRARRLLRRALVLATTDTRTPVAGAEKE
jgi:RNA polymerase sigma-70 factor, ECF subfamily